MGSHTTKSDAIAQEIRRRVLSGEYPRAMRLRQDDLAADFRVSITPVREALRVLESERLLVSEPHRGVRVAEAIDVEVIRAAYVVRRLVETFAIRKAIHRISPLDLIALRELLEAADKEAAEGGLDVSGFNMRFHFYFYRRCGLPELTAQIEQLWARFPWDLMLNNLPRRSKSREDHWAILTAAQSGDAEQLVAAFEQHLAGGMAAICELITGVPGSDPFDVP